MIAKAPPDGRPAQRGLPMSEIITFSISGLAMAPLLMLVAVYLPKYFATHVGVGLAAVGGAFALVRMLDVGVDFAVGALMDRTKTRIGRFPDRAILGCTHYQLAADLFRAALPPGTPLIHQPGATAQAMERYFARHPEYETGQSGLRRFLTTGEPGPQNALVASFWGEPLVLEPA